MNLFARGVKSEVNISAYISAIRSTKNRTKTLVKSIAITGIFCAIALLANAGYIQAKAKLAQVLIAHAFTKQTQTSTPQKPWPWADTSILAKLTIGEHTDYILSDASMRNLAFGPSHMSFTPLPGEQGNTVIVGHRDTHFAHLQNISINQKIYIDTGFAISTYQVSEIAVVHKHEVSVTDNTSTKALTLITCYPFNDLSGDPQLRLVVRAIEV